MPISGRVVLVSLASGSSPMLPHSATQMTLSLFLHVFGWFFGSLLISTLAAWLVDTKAAAFERREMHDTLRRHLEQHRVSPLLAYVVQTQVAQRMGAREHVRQDDVKALHCISPALSKSLAFALHRKNLATVRILGALQGADDGFLKEVCSFGGACQVHSVNLARTASEPCSWCRAIVRICEPRTSKCQTCWTS